MVFLYKAKIDGNIVSGQIEAEDARAARAALVSSDVFPLSIKAKGRPARFRIGKKRVSTVNVVLFTKQLKTLLGSGIPVVEALTGMADQEETRLSEVARSIAGSVTSGSLLHEAFRKHEDVFGRLYCNLIKAGEESGSLPEVMAELVNVLEHGYRTRRDIKKAMTYPVIVLVTLVAAFIVMVMFVIPNFASMFTKAGVSLPWPTRACMGLQSFISHWWPGILVFLAAGLGGLSVFAGTPKGKVALSRLALKLPVVGKVLHKGAIARFAAVFGILQKNGILVANAVDIIAGTIGNHAIEREFVKAGIRLHNGSGIAESLSPSPYFKGMILSMVSTGEKSGNLDDMLVQASSHYDEEVKHEVGRLSEIVGPAMVAGLAVIVGFFALAIYLPLAEIMQNSMAGGF